MSQVKKNRVNLVARLLRGLNRTKRLSIARANRIFKMRLTLKIQKKIKEKKINLKNNHST